MKRLLILLMLFCAVRADAVVIRGRGYYVPAAVTSYQTWTNPYMSYRSVWHDYQSNGVDVATNRIAYDHNPNFPLDATNLPASSEPVATIVGTNALGVVDYAYLFDGVNDYQQMARTRATDMICTNFTVTAWVFLKSKPTGSLNSIIVGDYRTTGDTRWDLDVGTSTVSKLSFIVRDDDGDIAIAEDSTFIITGQWYHVTGERIGTNVYIYTNGVLAGTGGNTSLDDGIWTEPDPPPNIGKQNVAGAIYFNGYIDNVYVYPGIAIPVAGLTNEVWNTDHRGINPYGNMEDTNRWFIDFAEPVMGLNMRTVSEPTVPDYTTNGNDAINVSNCVQTVEGTNEHGTTCYSYAFSSAGDKQWLNCNSVIPEIQILNNATISFWFKYNSPTKLSSLFCASDSDQATDYIGIACTNNLINFNLRDATVSRIIWTSGSVLVSNTWYHFAVTLSSYGNSFYLNGSKITGSYTSGDATVTNCFSSIDDLDDCSVGSRVLSSIRSVSANGYIANLRIYNYARQNWEIYQEYLWTKPSNDLEDYTK